MNYIELTTLLILAVAIVIAIGKHDYNKKAN